VPPLLDTILSLKKPEANWGLTEASIRYLQWKSVDGLEGHIQSSLYSYRRHFLIVNKQTPVCSCHDHPTGRDVSEAGSH
jgi:hypothetical protein